MPLEFGDSLYNVWKAILNIWSNGKDGRYKQSLSQSLAT